jgi:mannose-1-phosphate guanylyltransferase
VDGRFAAHEQANVQLRLPEAFGNIIRAEGAPVQPFVNSRSREPAHRTELEKERYVDLFAVKVACHQIVVPFVKMEHQVRIVRNDHTRNAVFNTCKRFGHIAFPAVKVVDADQLETVHPYVFIAEQTQSVILQQLNQLPDFALHVIVVAEYGIDRNAAFPQHFQIRNEARQVSFPLREISRHHNVIGPLLAYQSCDALRPDAQPFDVKVAQLQQFDVQTERMPHPFHLQPLCRQDEQQITGYSYYRHNTRRYRNNKGSIGHKHPPCPTNGSRWRQRARRDFSLLGHIVPFLLAKIERFPFAATGWCTRECRTVIRGGIGNENSVVGVGLQEVIGILPVDPYVETPFFAKLKELESICLNSDADIALMGVQPTYPSEKYGYIVPNNEQTGMEEGTYRKVARFQENPREDQAKALIEQGALWNCGVFAFKLNYIINLLIEKGLPIQYDEMVKQYDKLTKVSFDYEVVEKAERVAVAPFDGIWKDLGTWNTLTEEIKTPIIGNGIVSEDSVNTHLINDLDIPVTVIGCSNVIVATSPDGILVADKSSSPRIKDMMKHNDLRPMYEERRWGWYRVLDYIKKDGKEVLTKRIGIYAGKNLSYQHHLKRSEAWTVISGEGEFILNDKLFHVQAGDVLQIPVRSRHSIRALTDLEIIEVQTGSELVEEDIVRLAMGWEEICTYAIR